MLTEFGKICRKIRIDLNELLADMAAKLQVSAAFLSAVENGKKNIPDGWVDVIAFHYHLNADEKTELQIAAENSVKQVKIQTEKLDQKSRDLVLSFARNFDKLDQADRDKILKMLRK